MRTYSLTRAATELGLHRNTLSAWLDRGCPAVTKADRSRGVDWQLKLGDIFDWRVKTAVDDALSGFHGEAGQITKDEADRRKAVAQAQLAEIEVDERRRLVVLRSDAESMAADFAQALRSGVDNGIAKTAGRAATMTDPHEIMEFFWAEWNRSMKNAQQLLNEKWADWRGDKVAADADIGDDASADNDNFEDQ